MEASGTCCRFHGCPRALNVGLKPGQIVDATFVTVPVQRNKREENALIKEDAASIEGGKKPHKPVLSLSKGWRKKTRMRAGQRRMAKASTGTRITSTWIGAPS